MKHKTVVSLSGGLDSAVLLADEIDFNRKNKIEVEILAVTFHYGSKHNQAENAAAARVAGHYNVRFRFINIDQVMWGFKSAMMGGSSIPEGHYEAESMRQTIVPGRNLIFASILAGIAESIGAQDIALGIHAGDHYIYPDCRPAFVDSLRNTILCSSDHKVKVSTPFLLWSKEQIVARGLQLELPFHLTRTCYTDNPIACGRCGSCQERLEAFVLNNAVDPLEYQSRELMPKESK